MEDRLRDVTSPVFKKEEIQQVFTTLSSVVSEAAAIRDKFQVDDPLLRSALQQVERFLRSHHRICYGGMAINAHLPASLKFYDFSKTLPDYDFFTYEPEKDVDSIVSLLKQGGFNEVSARIGIHEGTTKIFVNYVGIADITYIPRWLYAILSKRAIVDDGISFVDADFLRMNMYLELSRPLGEVERWDKVYKRLLLLNTAKPPHIQSCKQKKRDPRKTAWRLDKYQHENLIQYLAETDLIFAGPELKRIYTHPKTARAGFVLKSQNPVIAYAENPEFHIPILRQFLHESNPGKSIQEVHWPSLSGFTPSMVGLKVNGAIVIVLVTIEYCQSYTRITLPNKTELRIASLDTAILLWYQMTYLKGMEGLVATTNHCFADSLVDISMRTRDVNKSGVFEPFSITCEGHQPSKASLLRAKQERIQSMKRRQKIRSAIRKTQKKR